MVRWCLNLKLLSSAAYNSLRTSGFLTLPSERTLRDYAHFIKSPAGFSSDLDQFLAEEADVDHLPDWKRHITLVLDEMKIKECLVYDKHETEVIGFADVGKINNHLARFERQCNGQECPVSLATHMLVLMVQGIFTGLRFPYVHFPTANITCEQLFNLLWEGIERLEHKGFKVLVVSADGAASNRKLFRMHGENTGTSPYNPTYKTINPYTDNQ